MTRIVSRLLLRVALVAASLSWAGFVFTNTVGDPGRGERIATAVLADDEARAEIVGPVTDAIVSGAGLPPDQRVLVADRVDALLADPATARTFVDPFAGSWARMLGEDDPRAAEFDLAPILDELSALIPELADVLAVENYLDQPVLIDAAGTPADTAGGDTTVGDMAGGDMAGGDAAGALDPATIDPASAVEPLVPVTSVPLPRTQLRWMAGFRNWVDAAALPLAVLSVGLLAIAFAIGERRRVLRRAGWWGVLAGGSWVVLPPLIVWAARSWVRSADAAVAAGVGEVVSGLRPAAVLLVLAGGSSIAASFAPAFRPAAHPDVPDAPGRPPVEQVTPTDPRPGVVDPPPTRGRTEPSPVAYGPFVSGGRGDRPARFGRGEVIGAPPRRPAEPTAPMPVTEHRRPASADSNDADDGDEIWDYYRS